MIRIVLFTIITLCISNINSQTLSRSVIGSTGTYYENLIVGEVHFTVGEVAVVRLQNGTELDEGFHSAIYEFFVSTYEFTVPEWTVNVYPNPTNDYLIIALSDGETVDALLFNEQGQQVLSWNQLSDQKQLPLDHLASGNYFLKLRDKENRFKTFKILKVGL